MDKKTIDQFVKVTQDYERGVECNRAYQRGVRDGRLSEIENRRKVFKLLCKTYDSSAFGEAKQAVLCGIMVLMDEDIAKLKDGK